MNLLGVEVWILLTLIISHVVKAQWDTAYSPTYSNAFLKLSNNEILQIPNNQSYNYGDIASNIITAPTKQNYSITVANGDLYAFYKGSIQSNYSISISIYNTNTSKWEGVKYNTTLSKNTNYQHFDDSTVMTSPDKDGHDSIYIYGGLYNNTVSNRILQYNPYTKTLNSIITSISPTGFYGSANAILDSKGTSNLLIGGKASSGWVSMFQIALWEYKSWTFKTVSSSSLSINSRINPLVLPVFKGDETHASSVLVLGGLLGTNLASPYVLNLNLTDDWKWQDFTKKTDFNVNDILGAVVLNSTLFTVNANSKKRSNGYTLHLYDTDGLKKVDTFDSAYKFSKSSTDDKSSSSSSSSSSESSVSSSISSSISSEVSSEVTSSVSLENSSSSSILSFSSATGNVTPRSSNAKVIVPAVIVPIISIALISLLCFFIYKKYYKKESDLDDDTDSEHPDLYNEVNQIDNQSISSWNQKRDEYERRRYSQQRTPTRAKPTTTMISPSQQQRSPTRQSVDFSFDNTNNNLAKKIIKFSNHNKPSLQHQRSHGPFANPEDYADKQELSPMSNHANRSRVSLISSKGDTVSSSSEELAPSPFDEEEEQIDRFLGNRDVQVLVSSKRRSKLRITNPDVESMESISEAGSGSTIYDEKIGESNHDLNSRFTNNDVFHDENGIENDDYVREILKAFDDDNLSTDIGSFDKYDQ